MANTIYSHAFLVGCFNGDVKPQDLNAKIWSRQIMTAKEYLNLLSDYYKSLVDSMVEAQNQTRPDFLQTICHYSIDVDPQCEHSINLCLTKGSKEIPYEYKLFLCKLHLYFFPHDIVLFALEIDDTEVDLDLMTLGHGSLINLKFGKTGNKVFYQKMKPLLDLVDDHEMKHIVKDESNQNAEGYEKGFHEMKHIVKDGNNMKIFQIVEVEGEKPEDNMLFEIGTFSPIGSVGGTDNNSPSEKYFTQIISDNSISVYYNWKALALVDSFTVLGVDGYNKWTWANLYFPLIYLRCNYEKAFCFSRNDMFRIDKKGKNLNKEMMVMEKFYFYDDISYNFLPDMIYKSMAKGLGLKEEKDYLFKQIKEKADNNKSIWLSSLSALAVFSVCNTLSNNIKNLGKLIRDIKDYVIIGNFKCDYNILINVGMFGIALLVSFVTFRFLYSNRKI